MYGFVNSSKTSTSQSKRFPSSFIAFLLSRRVYSISGISGSGVAVVVVAFVVVTVVVIYGVNIEACRFYHVFFFVVFKIKLENTLVLSKRICLLE